LTHYTDEEDDDDEDDTWESCGLFWLVVVLHSAGIGRTGTFIVMGFMLHQIMSLGGESVMKRPLVQFI